MEFTRELSGKFLCKISFCYNFCDDSNKYCSEHKNQCIYQKSLIDLHCGEKPHLDNLCAAHCMSKKCVHCTELNCNDVIHYWDLCKKHFDEKFNPACCLVQYRLINANRYYFCIFCNLDFCDYKHTKIKLNLGAVRRRPLNPKKERDCAVIDCFNTIHENSIYCVKHCNFYGSYCDEIHCVLGCDKTLDLYDHGLCEDHGGPSYSKEKAKKCLAYKCDSSELHTMRRCFAHSYGTYEDNCGDTECIRCFVSVPMEIWPEEIWPEERILTIEKF